MYGSEYTEQQSVIESGQAPSGQTASSSSSQAENSFKSPGDLSLPDQTFLSVPNSSFTTCKEGSDSFYSCFNDSVEDSIDQGELEKTVVSSTPNKTPSALGDAISGSMNSIHGVDCDENSIDVIVSDLELSAGLNPESVQEAKIEGIPEILQTQSSIDVLEDSDELQEVTRASSSSVTEREESSIDILPASSSINVIGSSENVTDHEVKTRNSLSNDTTVSIRSSVSSIAILGTSSQSQDYTLSYSLAEGPDSAEDEAFDDMPDSSTLAEDEEAVAGVLDTSQELMTTSMETVGTEISQEAMSVETVISPPVPPDTPDKLQPDTSGEEKLVVTSEIHDEASTIHDSMFLDQLSLNSDGTALQDKPFTPMVDDTTVSGILGSDTEKDAVQLTAADADTSMPATEIEFEKESLSCSSGEVSNLEIQSKSSLQQSTETAIRPPVAEEYDLAVPEPEEIAEDYSPDSQAISTNEVKTPPSKLYDDVENNSAEQIEKMEIIPPQLTESNVEQKTAAPLSTISDEGQTSTSEHHEERTIPPSDVDTAALHAQVPLSLDGSEIHEQTDSSAAEIPDQLNSVSSKLKQEPDTADIASKITGQPDDLTSVISEQPNVGLSEISEQTDVHDPENGAQLNTSASQISLQLEEISTEIREQTDTRSPTEQPGVASLETPEQTATLHSELLVQTNDPSSEIQEETEAHVPEDPDEHEGTPSGSSEQPELNRNMYPQVVIKPSLQIDEGDIEVLKTMDPVEYSSSVESTPSSELPPSVASRDRKASETFGDLSFESELTVRTDDTAVPHQTVRSSSLISGLSVPDSIHISEHHPASDLLISRLAGVLPKDDVIYITTKQKYMLNKLECTNEKLRSCNQLSAAQYDKAAQNFKYYTQLLVEMRRDVDTAFKRIHSIKGKLATTYPAIYERINREVQTDYIHPDEEELQEELKEEPPVTTVHAQSSQESSTKTYIIENDEISEIK